MKILASICLASNLVFLGKFSMLFVFTLVSQEMFITMNIRTSQTIDFIILHQIRNIGNITALCRVRAMNWKEQL